jgi:8-amino-7-oxononanoate synthase
MALETHIDKLRSRVLGLRREPVGGAASSPAPATRVAKVKLRPEHYDFAQFPELRQYTDTCWYYDKQGYEWNMFREHVGMATSELEVAGRRMINFSSFNYLDLSGDERVRAAAKQAIDDYGMATGSGRIIMGEIPLFRQFEKELAEALGVEDAVLGVSGYGTNVAAIGYLMRKQDLIVYDELVHNSMLTGAQLSGARRFSFPHNDYEALERLLAEHRSGYERVLIMTEGVFSMDGDIPDIPRLIDIKKRYHALLMVDEAHSIGVIGPRGMGVVDHFGVDPKDIDIHYASMSKSFGTIGGYIAGRKEMITLLKHYSPGLGLYIASPPPANAASGLAALRIMRAEPERAHRVIANADYFRARAQAAGLDTGPSAGSGVVPVMLGDSELALWLAVKMFENNIFTFPMLFPVVPRNAARLRFFLSCMHTREQMDHTVDLLVKLKAEAPPSKGLF